MSKDARRIMGVETEFGCLVDDPTSKPEHIVELIKDHIFSEMKLGILDQYSRDEVFEPAFSGGFLGNGGRLYIDAVGSHLEYATAECLALDDLIAHDRAGQRIIVQAIQELGLQDQVSVYNNSVDHYGGHTFGCHENYLVKMNEDFFTTDIPKIFAFLVTRQIFAGVGRVGGHYLVENHLPDSAEMHENPIDYIWVSQIYDALEDDAVKFQLSQRADHILRTVAGRVRFNRALINPKWEHFYAHEGKHRLHILFGESNQSEYAYKLKVGTTSLVLRLLEDDLIPENLMLIRPIQTLKDISRDESYQWPVLYTDGTESNAIQVQREYLTLAEKYLGDDEQNVWILTEWKATLDALENDPLQLADKLDWVAKKKIVEMYQESEGVVDNDSSLHSIDLEYHNIDPEKSLFYALKAESKNLSQVSEVDIIDATTDPPSDTRAKGRGKIISELIKNKNILPTIIDWNGVNLANLKFIEMFDPTETYDQKVDEFLAD